VTFILSSSIVWLITESSNQSSFQCAVMSTGVGMQAEEVDVRRHHHTPTSYDELWWSGASFRLPFCTVENWAPHWNHSMKCVCCAVIQEWLLIVL